MATNFPTSKDTLVNPLPGDSTTLVSHATQHTNANDAIEALEAKVGTTGSTDASSHEYKLTQLANTSGTNTGDETNATIKSKLGITTLSGSNTGDQDLSGLVTKTTTVNGHALSSNVTVTANDVLPSQSTNTGKYLTTDGTNPSWATVAAGGGGNWGSITGTLSSQTDLQTALDANLKGGHVYSVKKYGAVGNGSTDDTTAIQNTINAAQTAGGGTVFFPTGTYIISSTLTITADNIKLVGESQGSIIKLANSSNVTMVKASATTGTRLGFGMKDLFLDGNQNNQTAGNGIELVSCYNPLLENVWARYVYGYGIYLYGTGGQPYTAYGTFINCQFTDGYKANAVGIYIDSTAEFNHFINCNADWHTGNQGKAIYINSGNNTFTGVQADMNGYNLYIASNVKNKFINCSFDRSTYREVWMTGGTQHNIFENCSFGYYNYLPLISTGITSGATVTSISLATALPQDIPTWGVPIIVGYGTANAETYTVTSAGASAGATSIPVNSQVATKTHATTEYAVLRYRGVDAQGGSGPNIFKGCAFQGSESLGQFNINWDKQVGEDGGCTGIYIGNIWNNGNGASLQPNSLYDYTNLSGTGLSAYSNKMGLGTNAPTARLHLGAGSATAYTAPLKLTSGTVLTTPEDGAIEYSGTHYYATVGSTRYQLDQQSGTGSSPRPVTLVVAASNAKDVTRYDYLCTGTSDQTTIATAIAALPVAGGRIVLSDGTFNLSGEIQITSSNITIEGQGNGTILKVANSANIRSAIAIVGSNLTYNTLRNFSIDGNKANQTSGHGVYIKTPGASFCGHLVDSLFIQNCKNDGIRFDNNGGSSSMYFYFVHVATCGGNGFNIYQDTFGASLTDSVFDTCIAETNGLNGFYIGCIDTHFMHCKSYYNGSATGNYHGYYIAGYNNYFTACEAQDNYQSGFYTQNDGDATYGSQNNTFLNCDADSNNQSANASYGVGFQIKNTKGWMLIGCQAYTRPYPSFTQRIGVSLEGTTSQTQITNLQGSGNSSSLYSNTASGGGNVYYGLNATGNRIVVDAGSNSYEWDNAPELFWNKTNPSISLYSATDNRLDVLNAGGGKANLNAQNQITFGYGDYLGVAPNSSWPSGTHKLLEATYNGTTDQIDMYVPGSTRSSSMVTLTADAKIKTASDTKLGVGIAPTAALHLKAGTATANTAPLKLTSGTILTTPEDGAIEYNGTHYFATIGSTRYQLDQQGGGSLPTQTSNARKVLRTDGTSASWVNANPALTTYTIAATDSPSRDKELADYVCDGVADDVEISAALTALGSAGGVIELSRGTFTLAATIAIAGTAAAADSPKFTIRGKGADSTIIAPASGIHGFTLSLATKVEIANMRVNLAGASDGIHAVGGTTGAYDRRSFWMSDIHNMKFQGDFSTHSGYAMNLESPFRSSFRNIQGLGIKNGIRLASHYANFNPGNLVFQDCHMDLAIANGVAYFLDTADTGGFFNICTFIECDCIDSSGSSTTSIGWKFKGSTTTYYTTRDILVLRANIEQFNTSVNVAHSANIEFNANYVETKTGGTVFNLSSDSVNNYLSAQYIYVPSPKTTAAIIDANTDILKPNVLRNSFTRVETGGTLTVTKTSATLLEKLSRDSDGSGVYPSEWQSASTALVVKDEGTELFRGTRSMNFVGTGVTATNSNGDITVTIPGGGGGIIRSVNIISTNTTAGATAATDYVYLASGAITLTLPTAVGNTNRYTVKKTDSGTTTTIATTSSQTIDGSTTATISVQYTSIDLISNGTNWMVI